MKDIGAGRSRSVLRKLKQTNNCAYSRNRTQDHSFYGRALYPYATTTSFQMMKLIGEDKVGSYELLTFAQIKHA